LPQGVGKDSLFLAFFPVVASNTNLSTSILTPKITLFYKTTSLPGKKHKFILSLKERQAGNSLPAVL